MKDERLLVTHCPLCEIFLNPKENIKPKLYWPETIEEIPNSEFVIVECTTCKVPMVVYGDHVMDITREAWGRILYRCRILFSSTMRLRTKQQRIRDHLHFHVMKPTSY